MIVIISVDRLGLHTRDYATIQTTRTDRGITRYERGRRSHCKSIGRDHGQSVIGASGSELEPSNSERFWSGKDLGEVEFSEWWMAASDRDVFMTKGSSGMKGSSRKRRAPGRLGAADATNRILRVVNFSEEALSSLDACHHPDEGQILITTVVY